MRKDYTIGTTTIFCVYLYLLRYNSNLE